MTDAHPDAVQRFVDRFTMLWDRPEPDAYASLWHDDGTLLHPGMEAPIPASEIPDYVRRLTKALPDIRLTPLTWAGRGDDVLIEWEITATFKGRAFSWRGADRFTLRGERAVEGIAYFDTFPIWAAVDPTLRRPEVDRLGLLA